MEKSRTIIVDTRGAMAYSVGHIPNSINIRDDLLEQMFAHNQPFTADLDVVFVCPVGSLSKKFAAASIKRGLHARCLEGGITAWRDAPYELERSHDT